MAVSVDHYLILVCCNLSDRMKYENWPPPEGWAEVVITWQQMLDHADYAPNAIEQWCEQNIQERWHLHGYQQTEGFAFRFEDPREAVLFALKWNPC